MQKGDEDPAAAFPNRVPERNRPAMGVDAFRVDVQLPEHGKRLRGECLVELEQVDVAQLKPSPCQRLAHGGHRADAHDLRFDPD